MRRLLRDGCVTLLALSCGGPTVGTIGALLARDNDTAALHVREVAPNAPLVPGDRIKMIDGVLADDLDPAEITSLLRGPVGTDVVLTVLRGEEVLEITVRREPLRKAGEVLGRTQP